VSDSERWSYLVAFAVNGVGDLVHEHIQRPFSGPGDFSAWYQAF
jgi:hypothetical protein